MDNLKTDLQKLIALADAAKAVMETEAAADNEPLRRAVKATAIHAGREIRDGMKGIDKYRGI